MIITCEACNTSFNLDDKMLKPTGSKVRCSVCSKVFTAFPQQAPAPEPSAEPEPAAEMKASPQSGLAAAAALAADEPDMSSEAESVEGQSPETDVLEEDAGELFAEGNDLDFALDDEPEDRVPGSELEDAVSDALDENLADVSSESNSVDESGATVIASLDDDDLDLGLSPEEADEDGSATVIANLDDDDLDLSLDGQPDVVETVIADLDQQDFDLEGGPQTDGDPEDTATIIANLDDDALDLDSDFSLEPEDAAPVAAAVDDKPPETLDDLDDLDLTLDIDPDGDVPQDVAVGPETVDETQDELSLDFDLEPEGDMAEAPSAADTGMTVDGDLDMIQNLDDEAAGEVEAPAESPVLEDDLDLSSLESLLQDDDESDDDSVTMVVDGGEDPELTLDMDNEMPAAEADAAGGPGDTLEELEFDLDGDGKAASLDSDDADDADQDIDLSEIEKMLEEPESGKAKFSSVPEQDLDLDIDASLETEKWMSESGDDGQMVMDEELDLSELEQVLDDVDTDATDDTTDDPDTELELDLGDGEALGTPTETVAADNELDFDLSDFEDGAPPKSSAEAAASESIEMELEFEVEEGSQTEETLEDEGLEETVAIPEKKAETTEKAPPEPDETAAPVTTPKPVKKGMSKSLVFLLIIAILGGGGYGTYYLLNQKGIEIPFLSDYLKPKVQDPGNLKLNTYDINSKFVENSSVGKLFVISGKVKNGYAENRGMVSLLGSIFSTGKVPVHQEKVYCGNIMSDLELANLEWDKIQARLSNRLGDNRSNVKIEPGTSIPFMVVFSGLPEDLEEFTIEVVGSTSLK